MELASDFEENKVWRHFNQYETHIQNMHPVIPPNDLDALVVFIYKMISRFISNSKFELQKYQLKHVSIFARNLMHALYILKVRGQE